MKTREGELFSGVYLFTGLGSKGLTYSPLLAEYLGDLLSGQPPCLPANLIKRLETQRCHRPRVEPS
jgi:tRNA 5-methylaminomethyl-2-thiouridine biosynthesis bifunctional protein